MSIETRNLIAATKRGIEVAELGRKDGLVTHTVEQSSALVSTIESLTAERDSLSKALAELRAQVADGLAGGYCCQCVHELCDNCAPSHPHVPAQVPNGALLWRDMKTDSEKARYILSGRAYATGILAHAIQNDVAMAYQRCANYAAHVTDLEAELAGLRAQERAEVPDGLVDTLRKFNAWRTGKIDEWHAGEPDSGPAPQEITKAIDAACALLSAAPVPAEVPKTEPFLQFNLTQALALVESFGGLDGDMAVSWFDKSVDEEGEPMPAGLYAYCYDYPEEGRQWLGDPLAEIEAGSAPAAVPSTTEETIRTATQYAHNLVVSLHRDHYQDNNSFEPFDDLLGLLSQIDNMICGWKEPAAVPDDVARDAARYRLLRAQHWNDGVICCVLMPNENVKLGAFCPSGALLDEELDTMLAAAQKKEES